MILIVLMPFASLLLFQEYLILDEFRATEQAAMENMPNPNCLSEFYYDPNPSFPACCGIEGFPNITTDFEVSEPATNFIAN